MAKQLFLYELKYFINEVSNNTSDHGSISVERSKQLVKCSIHLLEHLPSSREVVLEYFSMVFDQSVENYIAYIEKDPQGNTPPKDETITYIQEVLESFVGKGAPAWAPHISSWSLRILGNLSNKYSRGRVMDIGPACTLWLGSNAMRCLLGLGALCFGKLNSVETEECISTLLSTFVQNSPHFDWVVARLGGCFPLKVISKILQCGLKGFVGDFTSTLDSEVDILCYLSFAHENDLKAALKEILQAVLFQNVSTIQPHTNTIPYLLHLCSMSDILLQPIANVFLELFDESIIPTLIEQSTSWPLNFNVHDILPKLGNLALKFNSNATKSILNLAKIAENYNWCQDFIEHIIQELEYVILDGQTCPLLSDLSKDISTQLLWRKSISGQLIEQQTALRFLLLASPQSSHIYHQTIAELLSKSYDTNDSGFGALIRILAPQYGSNDILNIKPGIELALHRILLHNENEKSNEEVVNNFNIFKNLLTLIKLEKQYTTIHLRHMTVTNTAIESISIILSIFERYLNQGIAFIEMMSTENILLSEQKSPFKKQKSNVTAEDVMKNSNEFLNKEQIYAIADMINILKVGGLESILCMADILKLSRLTVQYFFWCLFEKCTKTRQRSVKRAYALLSRQCTIRKASRTLALRELLEGALFSYCEFFGAHAESVFANNNEPYKEGELLMKLNQKQAATSNSIRTISHCGIIGRGLKIPMKQITKSNPEVQKMFLNAIAACCKSDDIPTTNDGFSTVALLLVEMISPDVMYNGLPWLDEEQFTKVTMERDLQIRRIFRNSPILWDILNLIALYRPAICYTSILLRALCASVLHQWRANTVDKYQTITNNTELYSVTKKLLIVMSLGQFLPPPLSYLHIVIDYLDPPEIAVVLKECIWNYMKENVPSPVLFGVDSTGLHWRDSIAAKPYPQFVDPLRNIMQRKLPILGTYYHHMFVLSELSENLPTIL